MLLGKACCICRLFGGASEGGAEESFCN
jgi:hypothetical protein